MEWFLVVWLAGAQTAALSHTAVAMPSEDACYAAQVKNSGSECWAKKSGILVSGASGTTSSYWCGSPVVGSEGRYGCKPQ